MIGGLPVRLRASSYGTFILNASRFPHQIVFEDLTRNVAESLDLPFVVGNLDAETSVLQETILLELLNDAFDNGLA